MRYGLIGRSWLASAATLFMLGCTQTPSSPTPSAFASTSKATLLASQSSERCMNVSMDVTASLSPIEVAPGVFTLGTLPSPVTLGNIAGVISTVVTSLDASGVKGQGAQHLTVQLLFESTDPLRAGTFRTENKVVCAPAGTDPNVCRVNDVMQIVSGTGVFSNAEGSFRAHGVFDLNNFTIQVRQTGRVCGDGL